MLNLHILNALQVKYSVCTLEGAHVSGWVVVKVFTQLDLFKGCWGFNSADSQVYSVYQMLKLHVDSQYGPLCGQEF